MKNEFITTLKGTDIEIINFSHKTHNDIVPQTATIKWSIELQVEPWGVRYWRQQLESFEIFAKIIDENYNEEILTFDNSSMNCELSIDSSNYQMHQDFTITRIEIDRKLRTAKAFIQG